MREKSSLSSHLSPTPWQHFPQQNIQLKNGKRKQNRYNHASDV
ncbi:hypothetical protein VOA_003181 [Vibrio sp. RC586]|nr:hypothetical protein VOA_003181 [Vibrio sp. RC586]